MEDRCWSDSEDLRSFLRLWGFVGAQLDEDAGAVFG
jgi:hypothetical protein